MEITELIDIIIDYLNGNINQVRLKKRNSYETV